MRILTFFIVLTLLPALVYATNTDVSPGELYFDKLLRGGYSEKIVTIKGDNNSDIYISAAGPIQDWISFDKSRLPIQFKVIVKPPLNVPLGLYEGHIIVTVLTTNNKMTSSMGSSFAVKTRVYITDEEIKQLKVNTIEVFDTEEGYPIRFLINVSNEGNVDVSPLIKISITDKNKKILKSISFNQEVLPTTTKKIEINAPSSGLITGQYHGKITVFLNNTFVREQTMLFDLFKKGTLKKGRLERIINKPVTYVNETVEFKINFKNIGQLPINAKFIGGIYLNGSLIKKIESNELIVEKNKSVNITSYFKPNKTGMHEIRGHIAYEGKTSNTKKSFIDVKPRLEYGPTTLSTALGLLIWLAILTIFIPIYAKKWNKKRKKSIKKK